MSPNHREPTKKANKYDTWLFFNLIGNKHR